MFSMEGMDVDPQPIVHQLKSLGLTKYEALVYIALLRVADATATEIHGLSGVPRASVYPVLTQLQDKELVSISQSSPKRFAALPPDEGIQSLLSRIQEDAHNAQETLTAIHEQSMATERSGQELIWNLHGIAAIRRKLVELIGQAESGIRIIAHCDLFSEEIKKALAVKSERIPVEIFTHEWDSDLPPSIRVVVKAPPKHICEFPKAKDMIAAGGIFVIDDRKIFIVIGSGDEDAVALFSESEGFVRFFSRYYTLIREIAELSDQ